MKSYLSEEKILEIYISETLRILSSPRRTRKKSLKEKWSIIDDYFNKRHLLSESKILLAEGLLSQAWNGFKNIASFAGKKLLDGAEWLKKSAKSLSGKALELAKKIGKNLQEIVIYCIKQLPGGEIVLEFLTEVAGKLKEKISEMREAVGKKVEEFVKVAKKKIIDFFFNYVINDDEMRKDFYSAAGLSEEDLQGLKKESKNLGIRTINELNLYLYSKEKMRKILKEEEEESNLEDVANKIKKKTGISDAEDAAKVLGFIENKNADGSESVNPENFYRGKAAKVMDQLITFWLKLVEKNPQKYHEPFYESGFFDTFGETGFGLASAAMLGILGASKLEWNNLVNYIKSIVRGFSGGASRPPGSNTNRAGAFLFLGNKGNNYDASLFKSFITGIIEGSNIEVIIRALSGDATKIPDLCKRILSTVINGVKEQMNKSVPDAVQQITGEPVSDEDEESYNEVAEKYVDDMFTA